MTTTQKDSIRQMRLQNISYAEIANKLGLPTNTIKSYCLRNGLNREALMSSATICRNCGKVITEESKTRPRKFCSTECKRTWWNAHRYERQSDKISTIACASCGKQFIAYGNAHRKFCSQKCYRERSMSNEE